MNTINSTIKGKAFEYACLLAIKETIETIRPVRIEKNSSYIIAKDRFEHEIDIYEQKSLRTGMMLWKYRYNLTPLRLNTEMSEMY